MKIDEQRNLAALIVWYMTKYTIFMDVQGPIYQILHFYKKNSITLAA